MFGTVMQVKVDFSRGGNSDSFVLAGWSGQEDNFRWTVGATSSIAIPSLFPDRGMDVEADISGFDPMAALPLRFKVDGQILHDCQLTGGRAVVSFRIPPRAKTSQDHVVEIEHPAFRDAATAGGDARPLAICCRSVVFSYLGETGVAVRPAQALVVGNSHIGALRQAYAGLSDGSHPAVTADFVALPPGHGWARPVSTRFRYDPRLVEEIGQFGAGTGASALVSTIFGNGHFVFGAARHPRPFDFNTPDADPLETDIDRQLIPYSLAEKGAQQSSRILLGLVSVLAQRLGLPAYHVASPPPSSDNDRVTEHLRVVAAGGNRTVGYDVESPRFRLKSWRLYEKAARDVVEAEGGAYLPPPAECLDADGFLRKEMEGDGFHANALYGQAVLSQIGRVLAAAAP